MPTNHEQPFTSSEESMERSLEDQNYLLQKMAKSKKQMDSYQKLQASFDTLMMLLERTDDADALHIAFYNKLLFENNLEQLKKAHNKR